MLFKKEEAPSPDMFPGKAGVWFMDPKANLYEKQYNSGPIPQHFRVYMVPMMHEMWHNREHKQHSHNWSQRKHDAMDYHEINPQKSHKMCPMMRKIQEKSKRNSATEASTSQRHGFCKRQFSAHSKNEQKQNSDPEFFFEKQSLHSNIY